jgi:hypothetical protein
VAKKHQNRGAQFIENGASPQRKKTLYEERKEERKKKGKKKWREEQKKRGKKRSTGNEIGTLEMMMGSKQDAHLPAV